MPSHQGQFWESWSAQVKNQPAKTALRLWPSNETVAFRELDEQTRHWSEAFRAHSLRAGDRVLVRCGNTPTFIAIFLACSRFRLVMIPIETKTTHEQTRGLADRFDASALITPRGCVPLSSTTAKISVLPQDTALLKLTSVSTGEPLVPRPEGRGRDEPRAYLGFSFSGALACFLFYGW